MWLGYPIREVLERAAPTAGADMVLSRSIDGFTAGTPLAVLQEADRNAILAIGMNGEPLPEEHGFPVRMVVPGLYGYVSATKWVVELEVTRFVGDAARTGPIAAGASTGRSRSTRASTWRHADGDGRATLAGVAWHQHTGISRVEVQLDDGPWADAELADAISIDTWVQWRYAATRRPATTRSRCARRVPTARSRPRRSRACCPTARPGTTRIDVSL